MKNDLINLFGFLLIIIAIILFAYSEFTEKVNECTSDPIKFGVEKIKENRDANYVYGNIYLITDERMDSWSFGDTPSYLNLSS